jgi:hypothetical protein
MGMDWTIEKPGKRRSTDQIAKHPHGPRKRLGAMNLSNTLFRLLKAATRLVSQVAQKINAELSTLKPLIPSAPNNAWMPARCPL